MQVRLLRDGFGSFGEYLTAVHHAADGPRDRRLANAATLTTVATEGVGEDGGFAVPPDFRSAILDAALTGDGIAARTDKRFTDRNQILVPRDDTTAWQATGGIQAAWGAEGIQLSSFKPELQASNLRLQKLICFVAMTDELLDDAPRMGDYVLEAGRERMGWVLDRAIVAGTGAGQPQGLINSPARITVPKETNQAAATVTWNNVAAMWAALYAPSQANAVWIASPDAITALLESSEAQSRFPIYQPRGFAGNAYATLYGCPILLSETSEAVGAEGDIVLADLGQYITAFRAEDRRDASLHVFFDRNLSCFRFVVRAGGQSKRATTIKRRLGGQASHIVTLGAR